MENQNEFTCHCKTFKKELSENTKTAQAKMRMIIRRYVKTDQEADNLSREIMEALNFWNHKE